LLNLPALPEGVEIENIVIPKITQPVVFEIGGGSLES